MEYDTAMNEARSRVINVLGRGKIIWDVRGIGAQIRFSLGSCIEIALNSKGIISAFIVRSKFIVQFGTFFSLLIAAHEVRMGHISSGDFIPRIRKIKDVSDAF